jgi:hypothetical protein
LVFTALLKDYGMTVVTYQSIPLTDEDQPINLSNSNMGETSMRLVMKPVLFSVLLCSVLLCGCNAAKQTSCGDSMNWAGKYTNSQSATAAFPPTLTITMTGTAINLSSQPWDYEETEFVLNGTLEETPVLGNGLPLGYGPGMVTSGQQGYAINVQWGVNGNVQSGTCNISSFFVAASQQTTTYNLQ